jgi:hypothetical protein
MGKGQEAEAISLASPGRPEERPGSSLCPRMMLVVILSDFRSAQSQIKSSCLDADIDLPPRTSPHSS